eukprot:gene35717-64094_t
MATPVTSAPSSATPHATTAVMSQCVAFIQKFRTTGSDTTSLAACTVGTGDKAGGQDLDRKLCMSCELNGEGLADIRVVSSNVPAYDFSKPPAHTTQVTEQTIDFKTTFMRPVGATPAHADTQAGVDELLCSSGSMTLDDPPGYTMMSGDAPTYFTMGGIALDGVSYFTPLSVEHVDPFYPTGDESVETVDSCLAHPQGSGQYHYHIMPPCLFGAASIDGTVPCASTQSCLYDIAGTALAGFATTQHAGELTVAGLARDGYPIYGPYAADGMLHTGLDACNGKVGADGNYGYYLTTTFPYTVPCWGPAYVPSFAPSCTTNPTQPGSPPPSSAAPIAAPVTSAPSSATPHATTAVPPSATPMATPVTSAP